MFVRNLIFTTSLVISLFAAAALLANEKPSYSTDALRWSQLRNAVSHSRAGVKQSDLNDNITNRFDDLFKTVAANRDLVLYGGIASFGILMMGLAIGSASSSPKNKTSEEVKLLKQDKEKAENLAKLKSEFLNQVSHELRTPLAVIIGYIECITDGLYGEIEAKHQEILQVVAKQSTHLKNMIDQILIYSRLEAGKQPIRIEEFQLNKIVNDMQDTFDFLCRQKGLELHWELTKELTTMKSDATRLKEVISNLLQNAVKYTDHGSITVRLERLTTTDSIMVEVADTGMGIPEHHLISIFEPFMQAHKTSSEHSRGGIGLGLSIVKKHLEQIKGTISVDSELGRGSTFRIIVPRTYARKGTRKRWFRGLLKSPLSPRRPSPPVSMAHSAVKGQDTTNSSQVVG